MDTKQKTHRASFAAPLRRALLASAAAVALLTPAASQAWTVTILTPALENIDAYWVDDSFIPGGALYAFLSPVTGSLAGLGANVIRGNLADFEAGVTADAVIIAGGVLVSSGSGGTGGSFTQAELDVISALFNSNVRTLALTEYSDYNNSASQLAGVIGGTLGPDVMDDTIMGDSTTLPVTGRRPGNAELLTEGVDEVVVMDAGSMTGGYSLTGGDVLSLWGSGEDFLVAMDTTIFIASSQQFAQNTAYFLMGWSSVPEPATYAALAGLAMLAYVIVRRRR